MGISNSPHPRVNFENFIFPFPFFFTFFLPIFKVEVFHILQISVEKREMKRRKREYEKRNERDRFIVVFK